MAEDTIFVRSGDPKKCGLYERNTLHPTDDGTGEVWVSGKDVVEVAQTRLVMSKLKTGELKRVDGPAYKEPAAKETDENRSILQPAVLVPEGTPPVSIETTRSDIIDRSEIKAVNLEPTEPKADADKKAPAKK